MPYKKVISGIYLISTPNGSKYVGSSNNIYRRWSEHRRNLRRGSHHSTRLQAAWNKHSGNLHFEIICECPIESLEKLEQKYIDSMEACLNTTNYVNNVWCNPETRKKLNAVHESVEWKKSRSEIASRVVASRRIAVDCSNGKTYESFSAAAKDFGIRASGIKHLVKSQRQGKLGVRFKLASEEWREVLSHYDQVKATRLKNGSYKHSEETKRKMRVDRAGSVPPNKGGHHTEASKRKMAESQSRVIVFDSITNIKYESVIEASRQTNISRTQVRRLLERGERFSKVDLIQSKAKR